MTVVRIAARYNGPPGSANGGYACGAFAVATGADVSVRLLAPPPLEVPLEVARRDDGTWEMRDGDTAVATARPGRLELESPLPPAWVGTVWASQHYPGFAHHPFPDCYVCGPHRRRGDGLRIFPGVLENGLWAAPWLPADDLDGGDGKVAVEYHWAALDCPGYFAVSAGRRPMLLGEMHAHVDRRVHVGEPCTVVAWKIAVEGRRHLAGTALYDEDGEPCARALATWIELRTPPA